MYDYQAATTAQMDFIFLSKWTEVKHWDDVFIDNSYNDLTALME